MTNQCTIDKKKHLLLIIYAFLSLIITNLAICHPSKCYNINQSLMFPSGRLFRRAIIRTQEQYTPREDFMALKYTKMEIVKLSDYHDEKWLQDKIDLNSSLLGLGELNVIHRERKQPTGGRIDFVLSNPELDTQYEVEIQLGKTDESHIIRSIEYWDVEHRRYSSKEHIAVIIAEDITNRFFNVISLMNKSIPIIAIQLSAIKIGNKLGLVFTKILDKSSEYECEENAGEEVNRNYWIARAGLKSISLMDKLISLTKGVNDKQRATYNKAHVALGSLRKNFAWLHPRKDKEGNGYCHFHVKVGMENLEKIKKSLEKAGISFTPRKNDELAVHLHEAMFKKHFACIKQILQAACEASKG